MTQGILTILDSRSFASIWFWLLLTLCWTLAGRRVAGVPSDVLAAIRKPQGPDDPAALLLLDWLSLTLPRRHLGQVEAIVMLACATFVLTALFLLGFIYGLEMAQALVLLLLPFAVLYAAELRLCRRLSGLVEAAETGAVSVNDAAAAAAKLMRRQRLAINIGSILAVAVTAWRGAIWIVTHPFGF
ncbi:hypothetical protein [Paracoccus shanxieyensis]|uniref:Component of SufBCD complex n=1 Tax=Paracoccus shanxieyensis TaxID=2675752 RepID=A0A6L6J0J0_9RHOB|nr:hypothetical protein [Paracoccus shanxieyensis]MTH65401.1 hypothetical protein [Paracoccus shanxieyensis]MTH88546.1 hypothetical protein [Paracoccus shanxieyensis]